MNAIDLREDSGSFLEEAPASEPQRAQRVIVRMLFDPSFVESVYRDAASALQSDDLRPETIRWILRNDRRAFGADRLRRRRALEVLMKEFPGTSTLALLEWGEMKALEAFFSSPEFHHSVQTRGYMAMAFVRHLQRASAEGRLKDPHATAVLQLEGAMARVRRSFREARRGRDPGLKSRPDLPPGPAIATTPGVAAIRVPRCTLECLQAVERWSFEVALTPALVLCRDAPRPGPLPAFDPSHSDYLIECDAEGQPRLSDLEAPWSDLVLACAEPRRLEPLDPALVAAQATKDRLEALLEAGVLRRLEINPIGEVRPCE